MSEPKKTSTALSISLAELELLSEITDAANPGPWRWWDLKEDSGGSHDNLTRWNDSPGFFMDDKRHMGLGIEDTEFQFDNTVVLFDPGARGCTAADGDFIAIARTAVPALIEEIRRLHAVMDRVIHSARGIQKLSTAGAAPETIRLILRDIIEAPLAAALPEGVVSPSGNGEPSTNGEANV